jgi:hypothetical protein
VAVTDPDERRALQRNGHWRMAVWSLRVGYVGVGVAIAGLVVLVAGSTPWVLAAGVIIWLATVPVTLVGFFSARHQLPEPRPGLWSMRMLLVRDSVRRTASDPAEAGSDADESGVTRSPE